jgi:hypothetical protein
VENGIQVVFTQASPWSAKARPLGLTETFRWDASGFATAIQEWLWVFPASAGTLPCGWACVIIYSVRRAFTPATAVPKLNTNSVMGVEMCMLETETLPVASEIQVFCRATLRVWDTSVLATQWPVWKHLYGIWDRIRMCKSEHNPYSNASLRAFWLFTTIKIPWILWYLFNCHNYLWYCVCDK